MAKIMSAPCRCKCFALHATSSMCDGEPRRILRRKCALRNNGDVVPTSVACRIINHCICVGKNVRAALCASPHRFPSRYDMVNVICGWSPDHRHWRLYATAKCKVVGGAIGGRRSMSSSGGGDASGTQGSQTLRNACSVSSVC